MMAFLRGLSLFSPCKHSQVLIKTGRQGKTRIVSCFFYGYLSFSYIWPQKKQGSKNQSFQEHACLAADLRRKRRVVLLGLGRGSGLARGGSGGGVLKGLLKVGDDVVNVLRADRDADEVLADAGARLLLVGELLVGGGPGAFGQ